MSTPQAVFDYLKTNESRFVEELRTLLRFPSVSARSEHKGDVAKCAEWVRDQFADLGFTVEIKPTAKHPVVLAKLHAGDEFPTALVYGHYDVQPCEEYKGPDNTGGWVTPPFEPDLRDGYVFARGATDDKGQFFTHLKAIEAWLKTSGKPPLNLIYLVEGEEEIGSPNLEPFLREHKDELACDYVIISDTAQFAPGVPAVTYSLRGILCYGLTVQGAHSDLHSGAFGGPVPNPLHVLTKFLADIRDDQGRVTIPGFYDDVLPLEEWERKQWETLPFDAEKYRQELKLKGFAGEEGYAPLELIWARPTFEINGIGGGYSGEGFKTVLPAQATAKFSMRLVPNQDPAKLDAIVKRYIADNLPDYVTSTLAEEHAGKPARVTVDSPGMEAAKRAVAQGFGTEPVMIGCGGSIPVVNTFQEVLGVDSLLLGWGQEDDGAHSQNERFKIADFHAGARASAALFGELAKATAGKA